MVHKVSNAMIDVTLPLPFITPHLPMLVGGEDANSSEGETCEWGAPDSDSTAIMAWQHPRAHGQHQETAYDKRLNMGIMCAVCHAFCHDDETCSRELTKWQSYGQ